MTEYDEAQIFVAAIRILTYQKEVPPSVEDVCDMLSRSHEWGNHIANRLERLGIIKTSRSPYSTKLFIHDYLQIEKLPRSSESKDLHKELETFAKGRKEISSKVESIQAELDRKKKDLFAGLEEKLRKGEK
jgi:hypothetical protein